VGGEVEEASVAFARAAGFPLIWGVKGGGVEGSLMGAAARRGRASVGLRIGGEGRVEEAWVANLALALQGVLAKAGVLRAEPRSLPSYQVFDGLTTVAARRGGLWRRAVEPEVPVGRGGALGRVLDPFGRKVEAVESPREAVVLGIYTRGCVAPGVPVAELGHGFDTQGSRRNLP
jgi:predicted deacylase